MVGTKARECSKSDMIGYSISALGVPNLLERLHANAARSRLCNCTCVGLKTFAFGGLPYYMHTIDLKTTPLTSC